MNKMEWTEKLSVGVDLIDEQHKNWIEHYNNASEAMSLRQGPAQIITMLGFLIEYTEMHFTTEETHMEANNYPDLKTHKARHDELRGSIANLVQDFEEEGATHNLSDAIDTFLGNWLVQHIQEMDMKFGASVASSQP